jgi:hypothetical protein
VTRVLPLLLILIVALCPTGEARAERVPARPHCCPAPPIYAYPSVTRWTGKAWEPTQVLALGDRVRFTLRFFTPQPGWRFPTGTLQVQPIRTPQYAQPIVAQAALHRHHSYTMYRILTADMRITGRRWLGELLAEFNLRNRGGASIGVSVEIAVQRLQAPRIWTVVQLLEGCSRHAEPYASIWVRGYFKWLPTGRPPYAGWFSSSPGTHPVSHPHGFSMVLPVQYLKGNMGPPPNGLLFARGRMECASNRFVQDRYPLFP